jgi:hypothetical protein
MDQDLPSILRAARQLPPEERRQLAEQLLNQTDRSQDTIFQLGKHPIDEEVTDASVSHDRYLYRDADDLHLKIE